MVLFGSGDSIDGVVIVYNVCLLSRVVCSWELVMCFNWIVRLNCFGIRLVCVGEVDRCRCSCGCSVWKCFSSGIILVIVYLGVVVRCSVLCRCCCLLWVFLMVSLVLVSIVV